MTPKTPILISISQRLGEHPEGDRLHKLLYWVVKGRWEMASTNLQRSPISALLQDLLGSAQTLDDLEQRLLQAADQLSKPEKYRQVAGLVVNGCQAFYTTTPAPAEIEEPEDWQPEDEMIASITAVAKVDRFEVRQLLMQQIPPLKAKILIFSMVRRPFTDLPADWTDLKEKSLDDWMAELLQTFPKRQDLEARLFALAPRIKILDQGLQVAEAVMQSARL